MSKSDNERVQELCARITVEQDRTIFLKLCEELNRLLSSQSQQVDPESNPEN